MITQKIIEIIVEVLLFLAVSYFLFYKNWLKAMGTEIAKLVTIKDLTKLQEEVKIDFNKQLENHKTKLNEDLSSKIENLKSELSKNNIAYQIKLSHLHQERAKIIVEFYQKLVELQAAMVSWTAPIQPIFVDGEKESQERTKRANDTLFEFRKFYLLNKLYFPKEFCDKYDSLVENYWKKAWDFGYRQNQIKERELPVAFLKKFHEEMSEISKEFSEVIPNTINEIEEQFRDILKTDEL